MALVSPGRGSKRYSLDSRVEIETANPPLGGTHLKIPTLDSSGEPPPWSPFTALDSLRVLGTCR